MAKKNGNGDGTGRSKTKDYAKDKAASVKKHKDRLAAFNKQCDAFKKSNPEEYKKNGCTSKSSFKFKNPIKITQLDKDLYDTSQTTKDKSSIKLTKEAYKAAEDRLNKIYSKD
tara:strand:+ start:164 stop:502 length:339 start_codon:yes stop_codon:yes gene_type:complete